MVFSDAIIAFAITVAAIPLRVPKHAYLNQVFTFQFSLELALYVFSFFLIYGLWKEHHTIFLHIKRNNSWLVALNIFFLAMIVCIPVGFTIMITGFSNALSGSALTPSDNQTIGYGALLYLGAQLCANILLLLMWWSARARPEALFGEKAPEQPFRVYMTWRLFFQLFSFVVYIAVFVFVASVPALWLWSLGILILLLSTRWLVLGLYRHRHQQNLDLTSGSEDTMRLQLFSDAIFAVAITITVAQIDPAAKAEENLSLLGTYVFSFLILGVYWLLHYRIFHAVQRINPTLILLNFWFLLLIILAFIPSRLYTGNMYDKGHIILFSSYQITTSGILFLLWQYTKKHKARKANRPLLFKEEISPQQSRRLSWIAGTNLCIFLALAIAAYFTPIPTTLYIIAYLTLLGGVWLIVYWATRQAPNQEGHQFS